MKLIKRFFLVILGILIAFLFAEIILRIFQPKILETEQLDDNNKNFFKWAYLDIHEPFFKKDRDTFYIKREDFYFPSSQKATAAAAATLSESTPCAMGMRTT